MIENSDDLIDFEELEEVKTDFIRKWMTNEEVAAFRSKALDFLKEDLKLPRLLTIKLVEHMLAAKAMYNSGFSMYTIINMLSNKSMLEELRTTKLKLKKRNKEYGRASDTIADLRGRLARLGAGR